MIDGVDEDDQLGRVAMFTAKCGDAIAKERANVSVEGADVSGEVLLNVLTKGGIGFQLDLDIGGQEFADVDVRQFHICFTKELNEPAPIPFFDGIFAKHLWRRQSFADAASNDDEKVADVDGRRHIDEVFHVDEQHVETGGAQFVLKPS